MSELEKDLEGVVLANWLRMLEPSIVSTGVRTPSGRYDARGYALGARAAETFLVNSRLLRGDVEMALSIREHFTGTAAHLLSLSWPRDSAGRSRRQAANLRPARNEPRGGVPKTSQR